MSPLQRLILLVLVIVSLSACNWNVFVSTLPTAPSSVPVSPAFHTIGVGEIFIGTIRPGDPVCDGGIAGPCARFRIVAPRPGTLRVRLTWRGGESVFVLIVVSRQFCCGSPLNGFCHVAAGSSYDIVIVLRDVGGGLAPDGSLSFTLTTSLES